MVQQSNDPHAGQKVDIRSTGLKILIVDDENMNRKILSRRLAKDGHTPFTAKKRTRRGRSF